MILAMSKGVVGVLALAAGIVYVATRPARPMLPPEVVVAQRPAFDAEAYLAKNTTHPVKTVVAAPLEDASTKAPEPAVAVAALASQVADLKAEVARLKEVQQEAATNTEFEAKNRNPAVAATPVVAARPVAEDMEAKDRQTIKAAIANAQTPEQRAALESLEKMNDEAVAKAKAMTQEERLEWLSKAPEREAKLKAKLAVFLADGQKKLAQLAVRKEVNTIKFQMMGISSKAESALRLMTAATKAQDGAAYEEGRAAFKETGDEMIAALNKVNAATSGLGRDEQAKVDAELSALVDLHKRGIDLGMNELNRAKAAATQNRVTPSLGGARDFHPHGTNGATAEADRQWAQQQQRNEQAARDFAAADAAVRAEQAQRATDSKLREIEDRQWRIEHRLK